MRSRRNKRSFLKPACCWVLSLALVFSMAGTPAYAAEAAPAEPETPITKEQAPETPAVEETPQKDVVGNEEPETKGVLGDEESLDETSGLEGAEPEPGNEQGAGDEVLPETLPSLEVSQMVTIKDSNGLSRPQNAAAQVGDTIEYVLSLYNSGKEAIDGVMVTQDSEGLVPTGGAWNSSVTIPSGTSLEYTARYVVSANTAESLELAANVSGPADASGLYSIPVAVEHVTYSYVVYYYKDSIDGSDTVGEGSNFLGSLEGAWSNGSELTGLSEEELNYFLPEGYEASFNGPWSLSADSTQRIDIVYTPVAEPEEPITTASYTIYYRLISYGDSIDDKSFTDIGYYRGEAEIGSIVSVAEGDDRGQLNAMLPEVGYATGYASAEQLEISADEKNNYIEVYYAPQKFDYTIYFLCEGSNDVVGALTDEWFYGSTVHYSAEDLNEFLPESHYLAYADDLNLTIDSGRNIAYVTYQLADYGYKVLYYKDSVSDENLLGETSGSAKFGQTVYNIALNAYCPDGYRLIEGNHPLLISDDETQNVLTLVYERRTDIGYTVNYYQDDYFGHPFASEHGTGILGDPIPFTTDAHCPQGYAPDPELSGLRVIGPYDTGNVLNVIYAKKGEYEYEVRYYKDSISDVNLLGDPVKGVALYQSAIPYALDLRLPAGYTVDDAQLIGAQTVSDNKDNNILNIVYSKDQAIPYIVNYYLDSLDGELVAQVAGTGAFQSRIPFSITSYLRPGYSRNVKFSGRVTVSANASENVLNVVMPRAPYDYVVNYYKGSVSEENLIVSETKTGLYLDSIDFDTTGKYVPEGYESQGTLEGPTVVSYDESANVLNVVYAPKTFTYTINYYRGNAVAGQRITSITSEPRTFGTHVYISADELNAQLPKGFAPVTEDLSFDISSDQSKNVFDISFAPDFADFYNTGILSLNIAYDGAAHYLTAGGVVEGDVITYTYNGARQTRVVGSDAIIGAEFVDQTDGSMPVLVTVTRAGITSNALRTTVRIGPSLSQAEQPSTPSGNDDLALSGNNLQGQPTSPVVSVFDGSLTAAEGDASVAAIGPGDVIDNVLAGIASGFADDTANGQTIDDDATPLASPDSTKSVPFSVEGAYGYLFMLLAAASLIMMLGLLIVRKRVIDQISILKTSEAIMHQGRLAKITRISIACGIASLVFCLLWGIFLL